MSLTFGAATSDRVVLGTGIDNKHTFTILMWHYPTSQSAGRRWWCKGTGGKKNAYWSFFGNTGPEFEIVRATTPHYMTSTKNYTLNKWWFSAFTFSTTNNGKIYSGDLTTETSLDTTNVTSTGAGAGTDDSGSAFCIGNVDSFGNAYQGRIATFQHFQREFTLAEIIAYQWQLRDDADCYGLFNLGDNGTGTQPNRGSLGNGINGTVTGATVSDHVPLGMPFG